MYMNRKARINGLVTGRREIAAYICFLASNCIKYQDAYTLSRSPLSNMVRESWRMKLDSVRNQIMLVNLWLSMGSISLMLCTILPALYGMNLRHGLEETEPGPFYVAAGLSIAGNGKWATQETSS